MSDQSSPLDNLGWATMWLVGMLLTSAVVATTSLLLVGLLVWALSLSSRVLALAALPWVLLACVAACAPREWSHVLIGSSTAAAMCVSVAWWLS